MSRTDLLKCDFRLGLKLDLVGNARSTPTCGIPGPRLRQIQTVGDGQAGVMIGNGQAHRHLTIVLLAKLAAILPRYADRVLALLRKTRVIDDPGLNRPAALDRRLHHLADLG
jgi:hypothetical protein